MSDWQTHTVTHFGLSSYLNRNMYYIYLIVLLYTEIQYDINFYTWIQSHLDKIPCPDTEKDRTGIHY